MKPSITMPDARPANATGMPVMMASIATAFHDIIVNPASSDITHIKLLWTVAAPSRSAIATTVNADWMANALAGCTRRSVRRAHQMRDPTAVTPARALAHPAQKLVQPSDSSAKRIWKRPTPPTTLPMSSENHVIVMMNRRSASSIRITLGCAGATANTAPGGAS